MQNAFLIGLSRQVALSREMDVVANNIANIDTTGYKADGSLFEEYLSSSARTDVGARVSYVRDRGVWHDMNAGGMQRTGNPLDVAIDGDGFFTVQTPRGPRYTRNGSFKINAAGQLVTSEGDPVLGSGGPITFQPNDRQISISPDGTISVRQGNSTADSVRGTLTLVNFANPQQLQKDGGSTFKTPAGVTPQAATGAKMVQGELEKSNVRGVVEMSRMIEITRSYMQIASMLQQQSDVSQQSIDKLAAVPN
jgi:flagellar basal-body rod protein FlgF